MSKPYLDITAVGIEFDTNGRNSARCKRST